MNTVAGLFDHYDDVEWALKVLENYGLDRHSINIVAPDTDAGDSQSAVAAGVGVRGLVGLLAGLNALAFVAPGIGPVIAAGPLATTWVNTLGTTSAGGLLGVLLYLGFSLKEAEFYEEGVKRGNILVLVETGSLVELRIRAILLGAGAIDVNINTWQDESGAMFDETASVYA